MKQENQAQNYLLRKNISTLSSLEQRLMSKL